MAKEISRTSSLKHCNISGSPDIRTFLEIAAAPVLCNVQWPTREAALHVPTGQIQLSYSPTVGHIFNGTFDEALINYDQAYENSLHFSPRFQRYIEALSADLVERYQLHGKDIIDIGCGKGDFLKLITEMGDNRGVGFDKSCTPYNDPGSSVTFIQDFYSAAYAAQFKADFIACRHVLEHIPDPVTFLRQIRSWIGHHSNPIVFFEVPNALYTLRDMGIWDIIYEHCSYFTPPSLAYLFAHCGFDVHRIDEVYEGQFLTIEATCSANAIGSKPEMDISLSEIDELVTAFADSYQRKVESWQIQLEHIVQAGQTLVVWGTGSKGVTFLNALQTQDIIKYAVDINTRKQGMFVSGTGQQIVPPDFLKVYQPDVVLIMNPAYKSEIREAIAASPGIEPALIVV